MTRSLFPQCSTSTVFLATENLSRRLDRSCAPLLLLLLSGQKRRCLGSAVSLLPPHPRRDLPPFRCIELARRFADESDAR
jgi:hypothetical protein